MRRLNVDREDDHAPGKRTHRQKWLALLAAIRRRTLAAHVGNLEDMGRRFVDAWKAAETGGQGARDHVTFLRLESFLAAMSPKRLELMRHLRRSGPLSVRRLSQELGRDYKSVHGEVAKLANAGLVERTPQGEVTVGWDRIVTELDLAA